MLLNINQNYAKHYGIIPTIVLSFLANHFSMLKNMKAQQVVIKDKVYMDITKEALISYFPFMTTRELISALNFLVSHGIIVISGKSLRESKTEKIFLHITDEILRDGGYL